MRSHHCSTCLFNSVSQSRQVKMRFTIILIAYLMVLSLDKTDAGGIYECETIDDCVAENTKCVNNLCTCPPGHILNNDGNNCLKLANGISDSCEIYEQCATIAGNSECRDNKCICATGSIYLKKSCLKLLKNDDPCTTNDDCFDGSDYNSRVCLQSKCQCAQGYYNRERFDCRRISVIGEKCAIELDCKDSKCIDTVCQSAELEERESTIVENFWEEDEHAGSVQLDEMCSTNDDCTTEHTICSSIFKMCKCKAGYFVKTKKCVPELGMTCKINEATRKSECPTGTECSNGVCNCAILKNYDSLNQKCRKSATLPHLTCNSDDSCKLLLSNYYCDYDTKVCKCQKGYAINEQYICEVSCKTDDDCSKDKENTICSDDNKCICGPEYQLVGNDCKPRITGKCKDDADCQILEKDSHCSKEKLCTCNAPLIPYDYTCLPVSEIGSDCIIQKQCEWKSNSYCSDKNQCVCEKSYLNVNGNCLTIAKKVGDYCTHPDVCMENTICQKSKCTCAGGMKPRADNTGCSADSNGSNRSGGTLISVTLVIVTFAILPSF